MRASIASIAGAVARNAGAVFASVLLLLVLLQGILVYRATTVVLRSDSAVIHSYDVLAEMDAVLAAVSDAETGQRGFLLTQDPMYLEPYERSVGVVRARVERLRTLTSDHPKQQELCGALEAHVGAKLDELTDSIERARNKDMAGALAIVKSGRGRQEMDAIRGVVASMRTIEENLLTQRAAESSTSGRRALRLLVTSAAILAIVVLLTFVQIGRLFSIERRAREEVGAALESQRRYADENARLYDEAQAANRAKDEFLAVVSHELRTPLTALLGWTGLLRVSSDKDTLATGIQAIEQSARAQARLVDDLLDVSRITAGRLSLELAPVDVRMLLAETIEMLRRTAEEKRVELRADLVQAPVVVLGDAGRLRQVVWNILANALKFTPPAGVVTVELTLAEREARVRVTDTGEGIAPEFLPHVFERFRQADTSGRIHGGMGLGLAIAKQLVELQGGTISVTSEGKGRGSVFCVTLPTASSSAYEVSPTTMDTNRSR